MTMRRAWSAAQIPARLRPGGFVLLAVALVMTAIGARAQSDWVIPKEAATLANPLTVNADLLARGARIFQSRCRKCHGPEGKGNGSDSDPKHPAADLTLPEVGMYPDGVLFYRVWNGRRPMPAFKTELEKNDVWTVVAFVRSLSEGK